MKAPVHRGANAHLFAAAAGVILGYLQACPDGATREDLRDNLAAKCKGERYLTSALKVLRMHGEVVLNGRRWLLAERRAA